MNDTGRIPLPCHGVQPTYTCAWCNRGIPKHAPTPEELGVVADMYGGTDEMRWAVENGIHPGTDEIGRILADRLDQLAP